MKSVSDLIRRSNRVSQLRYIALLLTGVAVLCLNTFSEAVEQSDARWLQIKHELFGERPVLDGAKIIGLETPARALDAAVVPVDISAKIEQTPERHIGKVYLLIENNPSPLAAVFHFPGDRVWKSISTRIRVNAYTNVRVLAELNDGELYMVTNFVKASGGCSAPALKDPAAAAADLGKMKLTLSGRGDEDLLLAKVLIKHPNSSGLQFDQISRNFIPADFVREIQVSYKDAPLFKAVTDISISEDPMISFAFASTEDEGAIQVKAIDSEGRQFDKRLEPETAR